MSKRCLAVSLALALTLLPATRAAAHCPGELGAPYLQTTFAPIRPGGQPINLARVADGLTAPLKGTVAPGEPNRLYVVDQVGIVWAVNLSSGDKIAFLNVGPTGLNRLVTLGVLGPNTFDERGLLGIAFHPNYATNGKFYTYTSEPNAGPPSFPSTIPASSTPTTRTWSPNGRRSALATRPSVSIPRAAAS